VNKGALLSGLFSRTTVVFLFLVVLLLLGGSFYTYFQDRKLQSVSLGTLRMASWNLAQLGNEASAFDRELSLAAKGVGDQDELTLRYDVLWSRYDYLLNGAESRATRDHQDNEQRLKDLFSELKAFEESVLTGVESGPEELAATMEAWKRQKADIQQLVIDNFVGDDASRLVTAVEESRNRLANLRIVTLAALVAVFLYLAFAIAFVRRQSRVDPITGLPNSQYLHNVRRVSPEKAIITCEIRGFQLVLSDFGTEGGDDLLRVFAGKLKKQLGADDELIQASQSGFVMFMSMSPTEDIETMTKRLVEATTFDWRIRDSVLHVSAVMGVDPQCQGNCPGWSIRYQRAHRALTQARLEGQNYCINQEDLRRKIEEDRLVHTGLIQFFNNEPGTLHLSLVYQPIVSSENIKLVTGAEVLLRCRDERVGFVPPNRVVDLCERYGLGVELGRWLFRQIARETQTLYGNLGFNGNLSINLNPSMLADHLVQDVQSLLIDAGIPATALCMEITEDNAALEFQRINQLIGSLHDLGVTFALDDFGTGHSSLEYVRELKVDRLKIDRCFVNGIDESEDKARFLGSVIAMAEQAYMKSVIEGVENEAQWQLIESFGGVLVQGYYAHKPMPLNDYVALLLDSRTYYPSVQTRYVATTGY
jgi:EAL domain-containing protein (putative c-di-GMP-specific phosphodiesterase class I)/GGDEF domain-containing protein